MAAKKGNGKDSYPHPAAGREPKYPVIIVDLPEPVSGYWDGGKKSHFEFSPTPKIHMPGKGIEWGSYSANSYFTTGAGGSWETAISLAKRKLKTKGAKFTVEWRN